MNKFLDKVDQILAPIRNMYKHKRASFKQGIIGAGCACVLVCIIHLIITMFIPRLYGVVSVLYPICGVYGYVLLHGKKEKTYRPLLIIFLSSLAGVLITGVLMNLFAPMISQKIGISQAAARLGMNMGDIKFWLYTIYYALIPIIFVGIGMAASVYKIYMNPKKKSKRQAR